jgi:hypothetical protein
MVQLSGAIGTPVSATLLLLVEQSIAFEATAFVGTPKSSATWTLAQERVAARDQNSNFKGKVEIMFKAGNSL